MPSFDHVGYQDLTSFCLPNLALIKSALAIDGFNPNCFT